MSVNPLRALLPYVAAFAIGALQIPALVTIRTIVTGKARMAGLHQEIFAAAFWVGAIELLAVTLGLGLWFLYRAHRKSDLDHSHAG